MQNSFEKFKQLERKRLVRFCIHFGIMTMYQLQRFCSFWFRMILWILVVRWKERCFNVSILKRYNLSLQTDRQTDRRMDEQTDRWIDGQTGRQAGRQTKYF